MDVKEKTRRSYDYDGPVTDLPEETPRILALLREQLEEAHATGDAFLKLEPTDVERLCAAAGVTEDEAGAFRVLVRRNLVRLRGRWRENRSAIRAPVYVERLTEAGLQASEGPGVGQAYRGGDTSESYRGIGGAEERSSRRERT